RAAGEVVEVGRLLLPKPAEEPPERLFPGAAAEIPERDVDAGPGEVSRARAELPETVRERVAPHLLAVPRLAPAHERRHRVHGRLDRGGVGAAARFAPADEAVVRRDLDE